SLCPLPSNSSCRLESRHTTVATPTRGRCISSAIYLTSRVTFMIHYRGTPLLIKSLGNRARGSRGSCVGGPVQGSTACIQGCTVGRLPWLADLDAVSLRR